MRRCIGIILLVLLAWPTLARAERAGGDDWFPAVISARMGVLHGGQDLMLSAGGSLGYQGGFIRDGAGWFWSAGVGANWVMLSPSRESDGDQKAYGWSVGPEVRIGWATGDWYRELYVHLRLQPYLLYLDGSSGAGLWFGGRLALGGGIGLTELFSRFSLGGLPNLLELTVDLVGGGSLPLCARFGVSFAVEF